jgi:hypothetical protein
MVSLQNTVSTFISIVYLNYSIQAFQRCHCKKGKGKTKQNFENVPTERKFTTSRVDCRSLAARGLLNRLPDQAAHNLLKRLEGGIK